MPPAIALVAWVVLLLALFRFDSAGKQVASRALWIPVFWVSIIGSRLPSQWLGSGGDAAEMMAEGNGFDRVVYLGLIALALIILSRRSFAWGQFAAQNIPLTLILLFSLISFVWSEFPFVAFKRWFRDAGVYLAILVALTDPSGVGGIRALLRWVCFLLIPLSIVLVKYFEMGRTYDYWTGQVFFVGATTSKNMLGVLCLVGALYFTWDTLTTWGNRDNPLRRRTILINVAFIAMAVWLLSMANSATSSVCLGLGTLILLLARTKTIQRIPALLTVAIPVGMTLYLVLQFVFDVDIMETVAVAAGRNPDLTGRTNIWEVVLATGTNPLFGAGYESFWLGPRLLWMWQRVGMVNEAHNGFLEVYLTLGFIGLFLYALFLISSYWRIARNLNSSRLGSLSLALWTVLVFYNVTESALRGHLMWIAFLLGAIAVPVSASATAVASAKEPRLDPSAPQTSPSDNGPAGRWERKTGEGHVRGWRLPRRHEPEGARMVARRDTGSPAPSTPAGDSPRVGGVDSNPGLEKGGRTQRRPPGGWHARSRQG